MRLLIIAASDPYMNWQAQELLDALLVSATFGAEVSLLFQDDGILQLLPDQDAARLGRRSLVSQLDALPLFDIDLVYVDIHSLAQRGLKTFDLALPVMALDPQEMAALLAIHDQVIRL